MENRNTGSMTEVGLAAGLVIGFAIGLLYAHRPGIEKRGILKKLAIEVRRKPGKWPKT